MRVVITGASGGIGSEFTRAFLAKGYEVHAVSRRPQRLETIAATAKGMLHLHEIDLENVAGPGRLAVALTNKPIDLLINNAGVLIEQDDFTKMNFEHIRQSFEVNTLMPMRVCQALHPLLNKGTKVAQITSLMGSIADNESGGYYAYRMSKAALNMFNRSYAVDFPEFTSVVFHPGWVKTDMGGKGAPVTPAQSVSGMMTLIEKLTPADSGKFYDFEGEELPW